MKLTNTHLLLVIIGLLIINMKPQSKTKKNRVNKSSIKTIPYFNHNTQRVEPFTRVGLLYKNESNVILPLYGRRTHVRSNTWNYYTVTNDDNKIPIEMKLDNRECLRKTGCKELNSGDPVYIPEYNGMFTSKLYI